MKSDLELSASGNPLYLEEMEYKMEAGAEPLFEAFDVMGYCEIVDLQRESVVE